MTEQENEVLEEKEREDINIEETGMETAETTDPAEESKPVRNRFWTGVLVGALVTSFFALLVVGMAAGIWTVARRVKKENSAQVQASQNSESSTEEAKTGVKLDMETISLKLNYIQQLIDTYYLFNEEELQEDPVEWMYSGYVYALEDPYSAYYTAEEYQSLEESNEGEYCGIGVQVSQNAYTKIINVVKVFKGTPAEGAGMLPGDILTAVDDTDVTSMDLSLVVSDYIKGTEGTEVVITVYRESIGEYLELTMNRAIVQNPTVEYEMLDNNIGYIYLSAFEEVSSEQFKKAVDDLEADGMEAMVLDLRNNGGGVVTAAKSIADYLLPDGMTMVSFKGKGVADSTYVAEDGHQVDVPIVVLANGESASAAEVLTGALKDNDWATVVGTNTFGKGIAQGLFEIPDGSALKLTTAYYYVPSGECIHEIGIAPDVEVDLKEELKSMIEVPKEDDNQLQAAVEVLRDGKDAVIERLTAEAEAESAAETEAED